MFALLQSSASSGSEGQVRPGRYSNHPPSNNSNPEPANTQALCMLSVIRNGMLLAIAATTDPNPRLTRRIGNAQQSRVPVEANKTSQLHFFVDVRFPF